MIHSTTLKWIFCPKNTKKKLKRYTIKNFMHFMKILQHVPEKILMCGKIASKEGKANPETKVKSYHKDFQKGGKMNANWIHKLIW